ncbi:MAG: response regulator [Desulfofustis sp.]|jgi:PAS domain S-box-containing protein|nr:response regulator [Desulfofustis sp.]
MHNNPEILLVDDEERFIDGLQGVLDHYHYSCTRALTGGEAIALLGRKQFDLALLDVGLPDMSGCDIAEFITASCHNTTSIMLTGLNTVETAVQAMKKGAYDFLSKPINHDHLLKTLDKALEFNRLRQDLRTSEARFQILAEAAWEGIVVIQDGFLVEANAQFLNMFGWSRDELTGVSLAERVFALDSPAGQRGAWFEDERTDTFELTGIRKDGARFPVEIRYRSMDYLGRQARVLVIRDIAERVRHEQERLVLQEKLAKANKLEALGLMAGSVAHDLNNILTAVVNYPDLLLMEMQPGDPHYEEIKKLQEAGQRAAAVVSDLVSIARGRKTKAPVIDLNDTIVAHLGSIEHSDRMSSFPRVVLDTELSPELAHCRCSKPHIHKILLNLIGNALEAVGEAGTVRISTANAQFANPVRRDQGLRAGTYVKMSIADNGAGINEEDLDHIFDPFYSTKQGGRSGTGLGLAIVWNSVMESDGWVDVASGESGTVFDVYLPATQEGVTQGSGSGRAVGGSGETILLVDDETEQNETMQNMLNNIGYKTFAVNNSDEALGFLRSCRIDLVILDMVMENDMSGCQLYEKMLAINPEQKAIVISGYSGDQERTRAQELGIVHFLEKPATLPEVSRVIRQVLSENQAVPRLKPAGSAS